MDRLPELRKRVEDAKARCREALARVRQLLANGFSDPKEIAEKDLIEQPSIAMNAIAEYDAAVDAYLEASRVNLSKAEK